MKHLEDLLRDPLSMYGGDASPLPRWGIQGVDVFYDGAELWRTRFLEQALRNIATYPNWHLQRLAAIKECFWSIEGLAFLRHAPIHECNERKLNRACRAYFACLSDYGEAPISMHDFQLRTAAALLNRHSTNVLLADFYEYSDDYRKADFERTIDFCFEATSYILSFLSTRISEKQLEQFLRDIIPTNQALFDAAKSMRHKAVMEYCDTGEGLRKRLLERYEKAHEAWIDFVSSWLSAYGRDYDEFGQWISN